ncbi:MAG: YceI family protein [Novosphingobium sp.]
MFLRPLIAAAAMLAGASVLPAAPPPAPADPIGIIAGTYQADRTHTAVGWRVSHMGFNDTFGLFGAITGTLVLDPAKLSEARVAMRIPVRKVVTANEVLTAALLRPNGARGRPDYFGPQPPDAMFTSTAVKPGTDGRSAIIEGKLTLNGKTAPVTLLATFSGAGKNRFSGKQTIGFHGTATIDRTQWGLDADLPLVGSAVDLSISVAFELVPTSKPN